MFLPQKTEQGALNCFFRRCFTQSLSISEAFQVNIKTTGTPTVVKLTPLTPNEMTNTFIFMVLFTKVHSEVRKWRKSSFFVDFEKKSQGLRSRKIAQKYPILNPLASPEAWDNSPPGVSWFCTSRGPLRSPKLRLKQKSVHKCASMGLFSRIFTLSLLRKIFRNVFGGWSCLYLRHIAS